MMPQTMATTSADQPLPIRYPSPHHAAMERKRMVR